MGRQKRSIYHPNVSKNWEGTNEGKLSKNGIIIRGIKSGTMG